MVAEVGETSADDQIYRLTYDGSVADEQGFVAMGGLAEQITTNLREHHQPDASLADADKVALHALEAGAGEPRTLTAAQLEVAALDRTRPRRAFRRVRGVPLDELLGEDGNADAAGTGVSCRRRRRQRRLTYAPCSIRSRGNPAEGT